MLKYLISTTEYLIIPAVLLGLFFAYLPRRVQVRGRQALLIASALGISVAFAMGYMKNKSKLVRGDAWNVRIFSATIAAFLLFLLFDALLFRKKESRTLAGIVLCLSGALVFLQLFYALPDVLFFPYTIVLNGDALFSTGFLYRMIGVTTGLVLSVLIAAAVRHVGSICGVSLNGLLLKAGFLAVSLQQGLKVVAILRARRILPKGTLFALTSFSANHASWYLYAVLVLLLVPAVVVFGKSLHVNEPYQNPAELRKIRARWRTARRWCAASAFCVLAAFLNVTAVKAYANRPVELSAIEPCAQEGDQLVIPFEQVEDGHLHRFAYTTSQGAAVRFIIIKKPNSSAYGIGLDACDICGETGYYERAGQVVCNRCDVVMNINTIGFKGGCNPIPISYSIADGQIFIPVSALDTEAYNKLFGS